jgi:hypothetical protein
MGSCWIITGFFGLIFNRVVLLFFFFFFSFYTERNETSLGCPPLPIKFKTKEKEEKKTSGRRCAVIIIMKETERKKEIKGKK